MHSGHFPKCSTKTEGKKKNSFLSRCLAAVNYVPPESGKPNNMFPCCVCHHDITHLPGQRAIKQKILSPSLLHTQKEGFFFFFFSQPRAGASSLTATLKGSGCDSCISLRRRRCTSSLMGSRRQSGTAQQRQHTNRQTHNPPCQPCSAGRHAGAGAVATSPSTSCVSSAAVVL